MIWKKCFRCAALAAVCLALSACAENKDSDGKTDKRSLNVAYSQHKAMQPKLTISELKPGDEIRVAFNSKTLEWPDGEAPIEVVFMLYRLSDIEAGE